MVKRLTILILIPLLLLVTAGVRSSTAQESGQIGLVVQFGDGTTFIRCIQGDGITGYEVLARSGLEIVATFGNMGAAICKIGAEGCPAESCLVCQQPDYWSYFHLTGESWEYSPLGASNYTVTAGSVEGWRWGQGPSKPPPVILFDDICFPAPTQTTQPTATQAQATETQPAPIPTDTSAPTETPQPLPPTETPMPEMPTETPVLILPTETLLPTLAATAMLPSVQPTDNSGTSVAILPIILKGETRTPTQSMPTPTSTPAPEATITPVALASGNDIGEKTSSAQMLDEIDSTGEAVEQPDMQPLRLPTQYLTFAIIALLLTSILIVFTVLQRRK